MAFTLVTVTGTFLNGELAPMDGAVRFRPVVPMKNGDTVVAAPITVQTNVNGQISVQLAATDDPGTQPQGVTYQVTEYMLDTEPRTWYLTVPHVSASIDLDAQSPAIPGPLLYSYLTQAEGDARYEPIGGGSEGIPDGSVTDVKVATNAAINADKLTDGTANVVMTQGERLKLTGIAAGATANATNAQLRDRTTHTGVQAISTVTGLQPALDAKLLTADAPELIRDTMGSALVAGTNVTITPNDAGDTITIAAAGGSTDPEVVRDTIAAALVAGSNITITPNDAGDTITIAATGGGGGAWGSITGTLSNQTDLQTALNGKQATDSDLTAIAALAPANDAVIQRKAGAWTSRTLAELVSDLRTANIIPNVLYTPRASTHSTAVTLDASLAGDNFNLTVTADVTLNVPTGLADHQALQIVMLASGAQRIITLSGSFARLTGVDTTYTVPSGKVLRLSLRYSTLISACLVEAAAVQQ